MENLNTVAKISAKIIEISFWIVTGLVIIGLGLTIIYPNMFNEILQIDGANVYLKAEMSNDVTLMINQDGSVNFTTLRLGCILLVFICSIMAMIARNINLIFKSMDGTNKNTKKASPFQLDVVRMVREIGIFFIAIPIITLIFELIMMTIYGPSTYSPSVDIHNVFTGIIVLCLSQVFAYGSKLEEDVDGLI
ncbi:hypothetical protein OKW23_001438 [Bacilli bacterium PM5-9]|nr:hypothetical protein [Bacilli bacterium PM5-9]